MSWVIKMYKQSQTTLSLSQDKYDDDLFLIQNEIVRSFKPTVSRAHHGINWYHDETITEIPSTDSMRVPCCVPWVHPKHDGPAGKRARALLQCWDCSATLLWGQLWSGHGSPHRPKVVIVKKNTDSLFLLCVMFLNVLFAKLLKLHFQIAFETC